MQIKRTPSSTSVSSARSAGSPREADGHEGNVPVDDAVRISGGASCGVSSPTASAARCSCGPVCVCSAGPGAQGGSHARSATAACALAGGTAGVAVSLMSAAAPQPADLTARLKALLPEHPFVISAEKVAELQRRLGIDRAALLQALVPVAREYARPPISNYQVGAAGLGKSGNIYLGVNLEFGGNALNQTVHGEQFTVANALRNGEERLEMLAVSAAPCGHCRQWLNEVNGGSDLMILTPSSPPTPLRELLPASFGPGDLGVTGGLLTHQMNSLQGRPPASGDDEALDAAALEAARASYAPYSHSPSGVAVRLSDATVLSGRYAENAAFNPSLSPLQAAMVELVAQGRRYDDIAHVVLVEKAGAPASQQAATRALLDAVQPQARFDVRLADQA